MAPLFLLSVGRISWEQNLASSILIPQGEMGCLECQQQFFLDGMPRIPFHEELDMKELGFFFLSLFRGDVLTL